MIIPTKLDELNLLITEGIEESINLEYKAADALNDVKEISKDVSSMANSDGGVIIYGIKEFDDNERKHKPEKITPVIRTNFSKERLEHVINGNISPRLESMRIHPISISETEVVYVIEIPKSNTAHQNTKDFRYYRRFNFESIPMLDYEIKDIMNRNKNPIIELNFEIIEELDTRNYWDQPQGQPEPIFKLKIYPINMGTVYARYINYYVYIPGDLPYLEPYEEETEIFAHYGENTFRDIVDLNVGSPRFGPSRFDPILPGTKGRATEINLVDKPKLDGREITWRVHADNASPKEGKIKLKDIKRIINLPEGYE